MGAEDRKPGTDNIDEKNQEDMAIAGLHSKGASDTHNPTLTEEQTLIEGGISTMT